MKKRTKKLLFLTLLDRFWPLPQDECVEIAGEPSWHSPGFRMSRCDGRDQVAGLAGAGWAEFEKPMPRYFAEAVRRAEDGLLLDVGANTGFYSLLAVSVSAAIRVVAYEPMPAVREILERNLASNRVRRRVSVLPYAASDRNGDFTLFIPDDSHGMIETSASLSATFKSEIGAEQSVTTRTLDRVHARGRRVAIIKIDAEGHDLEVLLGAEQLLKRDRPVVFVEVLPATDAAALTQLMTRCGYQDFPLFPEGASAANSIVEHHPQAWNHMWLPQSP